MKLLDSLPWILACAIGLVGCAGKDETPDVGGAALSSASAASPANACDQWDLYGAGADQLRALPLLNAKDIRVQVDKISQSGSLDFRYEADDPDTKKTVDVAGSFVVTGCQITRIRDAILGPAKEAISSPPAGRCSRDSDEGVARARIAALSAISSENLQDVQLALDGMPIDGHPDQSEYFYAGNAPVLNATTPTPNVGSVIVADDCTIVGRDTKFLR